MPNLFLSHTNIDKPFVEKLAKDLKRIGVNVWFDKWEIQVGDSITWKIEEGIRANEYLGIVLSPEALQSEWVRSELGAAWVKQMRDKKISVLPILYRACDIPLFLADRKYANFQNNYQNGLEELAAVLGVKNTATISADNWRKFVGNTAVNWRVYRTNEFSQLVTVLTNRAKTYNWSVWTGGTKNPYSVTCSAFVDQNQNSYVSIRLDKTKYMATFKQTWNPNHLRRSEFDYYVGNSVAECEELVWRKMEDFKNKYGDPTNEAYYHTHKFIRNQDTINDLIKNFMNQLDWYQN